MSVSLDHLVLRQRLEELARRPQSFSYTTILPSPPLNMNALSVRWEPSLFQVEVVSPEGTAIRFWGRQATEQEWNEAEP